MEPSSSEAPQPTFSMVVTPEPIYVQDPASYWIGTELTQGRIQLDTRSLDELKNVLIRQGHDLCAPRYRYKDVIDYSNVTLECNRCDGTLALHEKSGLYYGSLTTAGQCLGGRRK